MSQRVGDLIPSDNSIFTNTQARVNLGVEGGSRDGQFDVSTITPFCQIHLLSGVFHDPRNIILGGTLGTSGVVRYSTKGTDTDVSILTNARLQFSGDGGLNFDSIALNKTDVTLQNAFDNGNTIVTAGTVLNLFFGAGDKFNISNNNTAHLSFTGLGNPPTATVIQGDIWWQNHAIINMTSTDNRARGIGTIGVNTGSGLINVSVGSGLIQYNSAQSLQVPINAGDFVRVPFDTQNFSDLNYVFDSSVTGIRVFSEGLYKCTYNCIVEKVVGTAARQMQARGTLNSTVITPSESRGILAADGFKDSLHASFLFNAIPRDLLAIEIAFNNGSTAAQTVFTVANACWLIIEKIGPRRNI